MKLIPIWVFFVSIIFFQINAQEEVKVALINFLQHLSNTNNQIDPSFGWNLRSDPCSGNWRGITCDSQSVSIKKIVLEGFNLTGVFDAKSLCSVRSLTVLSIQKNAIQGEIPTEISNCKHLTHLFINMNQLSGNLPESLSRLNNLKRLDISSNNFSGVLPELSKISGLVTFLAQNNHLNGVLPNFDFSNFDQFNVSYNDLTGPIPVGGYLFNVSSFMGNPGLCGFPLPRSCEPSSSSTNKSSDDGSENKIIMVSGYIILGLVFIIFIIYKLMRRKKAKNTKETKKGDNYKISSDGSNTDKAGASRSEYSIPSSSDSPVMSSSSLVVLSNRTVKTLRFEDLLKAPAELLGRGKHGSLYKVVFENGSPLAVKRIKDWDISSEEFQRRMSKIDQARHLSVLPAVAFYCSKQEKLLVYEYQQNGSLFNLLHGSHGQTFDWGSRLSVAANLAEGLAFMHKELYEHGIAHGNVKSSNIMFKNDMQPCISEYGLMLVDNQNPTSLGQGNGGRTVSPFKVDIYSFGVMLLELLTGKMVQNTGFDLAKWVNSVVREEWTVEVFDKALIAEGASEESMVSLLQVAVKCINTSPENRPTMHQVATMINTIKEEEDRSMISETG